MKAINLMDDISQDIEVQKTPAPISNLKDFEFDHLPLPSSLDIKNELESLKLKNEFHEASQHNSSIDTAIENPRLHEVAEIIYSTFHSFHRKVIKKLPSSNNHYHDMTLDYCHSKNFDQLLLTTFGPDFTSTQEYILYSLCMSISAHVEHERVKEMEENEEDVNRRNNKSRLEEGSVRAKIRYVAGYVLYSVRKKYLKLIHVKTDNLTLNQFKQWEENEAKLILIKQLCRSPMELLQTTDDEDSLEEIFARQVSGGHLTHVADEVFHFFKTLIFSAVEKMSRKFLNKHGETAPKVLEQKITACEELQMKWLELFSDLHIEFNMKHISEIYEECVAKICHVLCKEWLKDIKENDPNVSKKRAHRVQILLGEPKPKKKQLSLPEILQSFSDASLNRRIPKKDIVLLCSAFGVTTEKKSNKGIMIERLKHGLTNSYNALSLKMEHFAERLVFVVTTVRPPYIAILYIVNILYSRLPLIFQSSMAYRTIGYL